jgi:hypothetical protein
VRQRAVADRREADPPIQVQTAMWSRAGQLDWWVKDSRAGSRANQAGLFLGEMRQLPSLRHLASIVERNRMSASPCD